MAAYQRCTEPAHRNIEVLKLQVVCCTMGVTHAGLPAGDVGVVRECDFFPVSSVLKASMMAILMMAILMMAILLRTIL